MFRSLHTSSSVVHIKSTVNMQMIKDLIKGFTSDKLCQTFSYNDSYPSVLSSKVVYKFVCASYNASYLGQTHQHLTTRIDEHFGKDKKSHIPTLNVIN